MKPTADNESMYERNGYKDREDYIDTLADDLGIDPMVVGMIADELGATEDFDGLVSALEDFEG